MTGWTLTQGSGIAVLSLLGAIGGLFRLRMSVGGYHSEQFAAASELLLAVAVTQKTIVANTFEAFGQDMDEETPNELPGVQRHYFLLASVAVILPSKAYFAVFDIDDTAVADRYPMRIAADIVHNLFGAAKWRLGVDNPIDSADIVQIMLKNENCPRAATPSCSKPSL